MTLLEFPELRQTYSYSCGSTAGCSILAYYGVDLREDYFMQLAGTNSNGTNVAGMLRAFRYFGLSARAGTMAVSQIRAAIDRKEPVLLTLQAYRESPKPYRQLWGDGHYVVAIGYENDRIIFEDPSSYCRTWLSDEELLDRWHDTDVGGKRLIQWGCVVKGKPTFRRNRIVRME